MRRLLLQQLDLRKVRLRVSFPLGEPPIVINGFILRSSELGDAEDTLQLDIEPVGPIGPEER